MTETIRETKHQIDGRSHTFDCGLVSFSPRLAVVRFDHTSAREAGGFRFPAGSATFGYFWSRRHYNLYRFTGPDERLIAYRFDVVRSVRLQPDHLSYTDLLLDAWLPPGGDLRFEDEDEVEEARDRGLLTPRDLAIIIATRQLLEQRHRRIVAEAEVALAGSVRGRSVV